MQLQKCNDKPSKAKEEEFAEQRECERWSPLSVHKNTTKQAIQHMVFWVINKLAERWSAKPFNNESIGEENESSKGIWVDNKDKATHSFWHGCFADCGQPNIQDLYHHHGC